MKTVKAHRVEIGDYLYIEDVDAFFQVEDLDFSRPDGSGERVVVLYLRDLDRPGVELMELDDAIVVR